MDGWVAVARPNTDASEPKRSPPPPCPRGTLDDEGYCDADGDLLADTPESNLARIPGTLIFSYTPVEDPAVYKNAWQPFLDHLSEVTGKRVTDSSPVQNNAAQIEAMRAGRLHVAGVNTGRHGAGRQLRRASCPSR